MKWKRSSEELKEKFLLCMQQFKDVEHKKMFGYPCCFFNGNMFTGLHEENWIVRLAEQDREALQKHGGKPFEPLGRAMREYIMLPSEIMNSQEQLHLWLSRSLSFVSTLPRKIPKRRKSLK